MRLYQDYKAEQEQQKKEADDREHLGISQETVIIYEPSKASLTVRKVLKILLLFQILVVIGGVIIVLAYGLQWF